MTEPRILRTPEAARHLGLAPATLETWRVRGHGPPFVRLGRAVGYERAALDAWVDGRACEARAVLGRLNAERTA